MLLRIIHRAEEAFLSLLLVAMTLLVFSESVLRFGFNSGVLWIQEATLYIGAWFVLFGVSYGVRVGAHIGVDAFVKLLPDTPRRMAGILAILLCLIYCGLFLYGGWIYISKIKMIGLEMEDIPIPKWTVLSVLIIGFSLLVVRLLVLLKKILSGEIFGFSHADEAKDSMHLAEEALQSLKKEQAAQAEQGGNK